MILPWIYLCGFILLPIFVLSSIPAIYPIYKFLIAPHLPLAIQSFFTDLKTLLLTLFSFCISGSFTNDLSLPMSLEDWVYSYLRQCNGQTSLSSFCLSCSSPSIQSQLQSDSAICSVCDICLLDLSQNEIPFFEDTGCSQILSDVKQIVRVGQANSGSTTFMNVMKECEATFVLYVQFNFHLLSRTLIRFLLSVVRVAKYILMFYKWLIQEVMANYQVNRTRVVAILFICILTSFLLLYAIRMSVRMLTILSRILISFLSSTKSHSRFHYRQVSHIHSSKPSLVSNEKTSQKMGFSISEPAQQPPQLAPDDDWAVLLHENSDLAGVVSFCSDNPEVMDSLIRLIEILYSGIDYYWFLILRKISFLPLSQFSSTNSISLVRRLFRKGFSHCSSSTYSNCLFSYEF